MKIKNFIKFVLLLIVIDGTSQDFEASFGMGGSKFITHEVDRTGLPPSAYGNYASYQNPLKPSLFTSLTKSSVVSKSLKVRVGIAYSLVGNATKSIRVAPIAGDIRWTSSPQALRITEHKGIINLHYGALSALIGINRINIDIGFRGSFLFLVDRADKCVTKKYDGSRVYQTLGGEWDRYIEDFKWAERFDRLDFGAVINWRKTLNNGHNLGFQVYQGIKEIYQDNSFVKVRNSQLTMLYGVPLGKTGVKNKI